MPQAEVLLVDDDRDSCGFVSELLETMGYGVETAHDGQAALDRLEKTTPQVVLMDVMMPGMDGLEALRRYRERGGNCPIVIASGLDSPDTIVRAMRLGAADYVTKPFDEEELAEVLGRVIARAQTTWRFDGAQDLGRSAEVSGEVELGQSAVMRRIGALIGRLADSDVPVLLTGESGVGKDVVARQIHARSCRKDRVFVKINCAALASELLESELFGHEKGSFTGADRAKPGQFELADGGTLFLDEIGEMPPSLQAKLLQALQDGEFYRVGGQKKIRVDVRVVVATNRDLDKAIQEGVFREDLYYRLSVVCLHIPPLRARRQDIPGLLRYFVDKYRRRYHWNGDLDPEVTSRLLEYHWPGNIRELENLVRRLMVLRDVQYVIEELDARGKAASAAEPAEPARESISEPTAAPPPPDGARSDYTIDLKAIARQAADVAERKSIIKMLAYTLGNKKEAAERLGISYKALLYKCRDLNIGRPGEVTLADKSESAAWPNSEDPEPVVTTPPLHP